MIFFLMNDTWHYYQSLDEVCVIAVFAEQVDRGSRKHEARSLQGKIIIL